MSKIARFEAVPVALPLAKPLRWGAAGEMRRLEHVLVRLWTDDGLVGYGEAAPRPTIYGESLVSVVHAIDNWFGPAIVGLPCSAPERVANAFASIPGNLAAKSALEMAAYDLAAKRARMPLRQYLGGWRDDVPVSYMLSVGALQSVVEEAVGIKDRYGINAFKVKAGRDPRQDVELIRVLRRELGDGALLYPDFNEQYDLHTALRVIAEMAEQSIVWVEEPIPVERFSQRQLLAQRLPVPILIDDSATSLPDVCRELATGVAGVVCIKIARTGLRESSRVVAAAAGFGVPCIVGSQGLSDAGSLISAEFAAAFQDIVPPADLGNFVKQSEFVMDELPVVRDGRIVLGAAEGSGVSISDARLEKIRLSR